MRKLLFLLVILFCVANATARDFGSINAKGPITGEAGVATNQITGLTEENLSFKLFGNSTSSLQFSFKDQLGNIVAFISKYGEATFSGETVTNAITANRGAFTGISVENKTPAPEYRIYPLRNGICKIAGNHAFHGGDNAKM